jgi:tRNA acetyltransferase TAN1
MARQYASQMYGANQTNSASEGKESDDDGDDIENEIQKEIEEMQKPTISPLFRPAKVDTECCESTHHYTSRRLKC